MIDQQSEETFRRLQVAVRGGAQSVYQAEEVGERRLAFIRIFGKTSEYPCQTPVSCLDEGIKQRRKVVELGPNNPAVARRSQDLPSVFLETDLKTYAVVLLRIDVKTNSVCAEAHRKR